MNQLARESIGFREICFGLDVLVPLPTTQNDGSKPRASEESRVVFSCRPKSIVIVKTRMDVEIERELLDEALHLSGCTTAEDVIAKALESLIQREAARRLAKLGGSDPSAKAPRRRRLGPDT